ncbi:MAG: alpha/beta fold hydrolase [Candidatus Solibacter usitatus]|nr:alpha/beta fold hydrolase [Candidatus Solibacter usitatus]
MEEPFQHDLIRGTLHRPDRESGDVIVLTHGAGSDSGSALLVGLARAFAGQGHLVLRYDLPFRIEGKQPNPRNAVRDREGVHAALEAVRKQARGRVIAAGHSYGGRQSAMLAAERPGAADGLLLLSYPLHPPDKPQQKRTDYFPNLRTPALFVHGTKDPFGSIEELREAIALIPARTDVLPVEGAAHDLKRAVGLAGEMLTRLFAAL